MIQWIPHNRILLLSLVMWRHMQSNWTGRWKGASRLLVCGPAAPDFHALDLSEETCSKKRRLTCLSLRPILFKVMNTTRSSIQNIRVFYNKDSRQQRELGLTTKPPNFSKQSKIIRISGVPSSVHENFNLRQETASSEQVRSLLLHRYQSIIMPIGHKTEMQDTKQLPSLSIPRTLNWHFSEPDCNHIGIRELRSGSLCLKWLFQLK